MKLTRTTFFILLFAGFFTYTTKAQEVIAVTGGTIQTESVKIDFTIGETLTETLSSGEYILSQGMHQGIYTITSLEELSEPAYIITLSPNPVYDNLTLSINNVVREKIFIILYDINGNLLLKIDATGNETNFSLTDYTPGTYLLKVMSNNQIIKVFQIVKK
jgi:hypothetical protein